MTSFLAEFVGGPRDGENRLLRPSEDVVCFSTRVYVESAICRKPIKLRRHHFYRRTECQSARGAIIYRYAP